MKSLLWAFVILVFNFLRHYALKVFLNREPLASPFVFVFFPLCIFFLFVFGQRYLGVSLLINYLDSLTRLQKSAIAMSPPS